jgi:hypothetical protein
MWCVTTNNGAQTNDCINGSGFSQNLRSKGDFKRTRNPMFHNVIVGNTATLETAQCAVA